MSSWDSGLKVFLALRKGQAAHKQHLQAEPRGQRISQSPVL